MDKRMALWRRAISQLPRAPRRKKKRKSGQEWARKHQLEPLEKREMLSVSTLLVEEITDTALVASAPQSFRAGDFSLTTIDWSGHDSGGVLNRTASAFGPRSGQANESTTAFDPGEFWSFGFDQSGTIMGIQFDHFDLEDADIAQLEIGGETFVITGEQVQGGFWRPDHPLAFSPGDTIRLTALAATTDDVQDALDARIATNEALVEAELETVTFDTTPSSVWQIAGIHTLGDISDDVANPTTIGGYIDLTQSEQADPIYSFPIPSETPDSPSFVIVDGEENFEVTTETFADGTQYAVVTVKDNVTLTSATTYQVRLAYFDGTVWTDQQFVTIETPEAGDADAEFATALADIQASAGQLDIGTAALIISQIMQTARLNVVEDAFTNNPDDPETALKLLTTITNTLLNRADFLGQPGIRLMFYQAIDHILDLVESSILPAASEDDKVIIKGELKKIRVLKEDQLKKDKESGITQLMLNAMHVENALESTLGNDWLNVLLFGILPNGEVTTETSSFGTTHEVSYGNGLLSVTDQISVSLSQIATVTVTELNANFSRAPEPEVRADAFILLPQAQAAQAPEGGGGGGGTAAASSGDGPEAVTEIELLGFDVDPNNHSRLRLTYQTQATAEGSWEFEVAVYRSLNGVTPIGDPIITAVASTATGVVTFDADLTNISEDDEQEDYYLIAKIDTQGIFVNDTNASNNMRAFDGGVFLATDGTVHVQSANNYVNDSIQLNYDDKSALFYVVEAGQTVFVVGIKSVSDIHVRTHGGNDSISTASNLEKPVWAFGGYGSDTLQGGQENDLLIGGYSSDYIYGRDGDDYIEGGDEYGGYGGYGGDFIYGNDGNDTIFGGYGSDYIIGGYGGDVIDGGYEYGYEGYWSGGHWVEYEWQAGGYGGGGFWDNMYGGYGGGDYILGGKGEDIIDGGYGNDYIDGGQGDDTIHGNEQRDYLVGDYDNDTLYGDEDKDKLEGSQGDDTLYGGDDVDELYGQAGDDELWGGEWQ